MLLLSLTVSVGSFSSVKKPMFMLQNCHRNCSRTTVAESQLFLCRFLKLLLSALVVDVKGTKRGMSYNEDADCFLSP